MPPAGTTAIVEITSQAQSTDPPRDWITNTLHFNTTGTGLLTADWNALATAIQNVWIVTTGHWGYPNTTITINVYNLADAKPRPEKAHTVYTPTTWGSENLPRQIALCVSYYSGRNLKRQRGRVYLFPHNNVSGASQVRPSGAYQTAAVALIKAVATAAAALPPTWQLCVYSHADNQVYPISNLWCNDVWDTQRRRTPKETTRATAIFP